MGPSSRYEAPLIAGMTLFLLLLAIPNVLDDGDTLWQIRTGEWVLRNLTIPHTDPFSFTFAGQHWFAHEWGSETLMGVAYWAGGLRGVMVLTALASGLTAGLLLYHLRAFMAPLPALIVLIQGMANTMASLLARPHVLAWPCLELWCAGLVIARARNRGPSWWLLPVMAVWVNLHGSFMVGLLLPLAFLAEAALDAGTSWRQPATEWLRFTAAAWAVALLNPDTVEGVLFPFRLLGMTNLGWINEWHPTDFGSPHPLEIVIMVLLAAGLLGRLTLPPFRLLMVLGLIHMALRHWRHDQLLGIIGPLILAEAIGRMAPRVAAAVGWPGTSPETSQTATPDDSRPILPSASRVVRIGGWTLCRSRIVLPAALAGLAMVAVSGRFLVPLDREQPGMGVSATLDSVPELLRARPVLNDYSFGGELIFRGIPTFIDSRADLFGDAFLTRFRDITGSNPDALMAALEEFQIAWTLFPPDSAVVSLLDHQPGWHRLTSGKQAVVHVRDKIAGL